MLAYWLGPLPSTVVCDVLRKAWDPSRCDPPDGVSPTGQRPYEEVVSLSALGLRTSSGTVASSNPGRLPGGSCRLKIGDWLPEVPVKIWSACESRSLHVRPYLHNLISFGFVFLT